MARHKDANWTLPETLEDWQQAQLAVLMDIRDELKRMNAVIQCSNFIAVPSILRRISTNTAKPRKKAVK